MAYDGPNYTQAPNLFFDEHLSEIKSLAELKVTLVIFRNTIGWHEDTVDMTTAELMKATGMSRPSVVEGVRLALGRGTIKRVQKGRSFAYEPNIVSVKNLNRSRKPDSKYSLPRSVKNSDRSSTLSLSSERNLKESKPLAGEKSEASSVDPYIEDRSELLALLEEKIGRVRYLGPQTKALNWLFGEGYSPDQCKRCFEYLLTQSWRGVSVTWKTVCDEIGTWVSRGFPAMAAPNNTQRADTPGAIAAQGGKSIFRKGLNEQ